MNLLLATGFKACATNNSKVRRRHNATLSATSTSFTQVVLLIIAATTIAHNGVVCSAFGQHALLRTSTNPVVDRIVMLQQPVDSKKRRPERRGAAIFFSMPWHASFEPPQFDARTIQANDGTTHYNVLYSPPPEEEEEEGSQYPIITLFTRDNLEEDIIQILQSCFDKKLLHSLYIVDVALESNQKWYGKYKYELPILHMGNFYWMKRRGLTNKIAEGSLSIAMLGRNLFPPGRDEPNAAEMERQLSAPSPTSATRLGGEVASDDKENRPRRSRSGSFQKQMVKAIADKAKGTCDLPEE
jgi:hypothetical protein